MSTTVDQRVVEMRFDNKHFESNVSTTMSTLDKLKAKLGFDGATKGLENVSNAAKNVNMSSLSSSVETVQAKFSALEVIGVTALANITNSAVNAGKELVKSLSVDQIAAGWNKFGQKTMSVATLKAQGFDMDEIEEQLSRLNWFTDETSYNYTDMVESISKFTATGKGLTESVNAMEGIATWAALSGQNAQKASSAMYQLSQAMGAGVMRKEDYKSIQNVSMDSVEFRQKALDAAVALGTLKKNADNTYTSLVATGKAGAEAFSINQFAERLTDGAWFTSDVMMSVFGEYSKAVDEIYKITEEKGMLASEVIDEIHKKAEKEGISTNEAIKALGYNFDDFALKAFEAGQKARTFGDAIDSVKDAVSTGWMNTFEIIFGDADEATELWTDLANTLWDVFAAGAEVRNWVIGTALKFAEPWKAIEEKLGKVTKVVDNLKNVSGTLKDFQEIVDNVWLGNFNNWGDNPDRRDLLTQAGWDYRVVQELVNIGEASWQAGKRYQLSMEEVEAAHAKYGLTMKATKEETAQVVTAYNELTDAQLEKLGLTEEEIDLYRALEKEAKRTGRTVSDIAKEMSENDGRTMLIDSFKNLGSVILDTLTIAKEAFNEIFNPPGSGEMIIRLYNIIKTLKNFTESLRLTDKETGDYTENGEKLIRTFKGIFAALDIVLTIISGPLKIAFKLITQLLSVFGFNILDVTAFIGDGIVALRDWIDSVLDFTGVFEKMVDPIKNATKEFKEWIENLKKSENLPQDIAKGIASGFGKMISAIGSFFKSIPKLFTDGFASISDSPLGGFINGIKNGFVIAGQTIVELGKIILEKINGFLSARGLKTISTDSIAGLVEGFKEGASKAWKAAVEMVTKLVDKVKEFLGIHSPSTVFMAIGGFIIAGLISGLKNSSPDAFGAFKGVFEPIINWLNNIDFGSIFAGIIGIGTVAGVYKMTSGIGNMMDGLGEVFVGTGEILQASARPIRKILKNTAKVVKSFSRVLNAVALDITAGAILKIAQAIVLLAAAVFILAKFLKPGELWGAIGAIAVLALILIGLAFAMSKLNTASASIDKTGLSVKGLSSGLISIGLALLMLGATVKMLGSMNPDQIQQGFLSLVGIVAVIGAFLIAFMKIPFGPSDAVIVQSLGKTLKNIATALLIMAVVAKLLGGMNPAELDQGISAIAKFALVMAALMFATQLINGSKNVSTIGGTLLKISLAIGVMALVAKSVGGMDPAEINRGVLGIAAFGGIIVALMWATKLVSGSKNVATIGSTLLKIGIAIGIMGLVVKQLGGMKPDEINRGVLGIAAFGGIIVALMYATKLVTGSKNIGKIGGTILAISGAIAIMGFTALMLSMVSWEGFAKGIVMITAFSAIIVGLIWATKLVGNNADKLAKTILSIAGAIAILALVGVLLGLIPIKNLITGGIAIAVLAGIMAGLIYVTSLVKGNIVGTMIVLAVIIGILGGVLITLSCLKPASVITATIALSVLLAVLGGVMQMLIPIGKQFKNAMKGAIALLVLSKVIKELGSTLATMRDVDNALVNALALSLLCIALTAVLIPLSVIGKSAKDAAMGALALAAMAAPLALFGLVLAMMSALKVTDAIPNVIALSILCTVLTALLIPLSVIGILVAATSGAILLGVVALLAMAVPLVAFVGIIALMSGIQNGVANAMALTLLMAVLGDVLFKISLVAPLAVIAVGALTALVGLMVGVGALALAMGALVTKFPQLQTFLDVGIPLLVQMAGGLGQMIGAFISALAGEVMTILPQLGMCLSQFMINATPFITGAKMVDETVLAGVGILAGAVLALTAADLISGVLSFLQGGSSFADLGTQLSLFMLNALPFITTAAMITPEMVSGVKALAETIMIITAANLLEGITSFVTGGSSLETFAAQLPILGQGIAAFAASLGSLGPDQLETIDSAAKAIKSLASAAAEIPNTGGLLASIVGENDLGVFAAQFPILGIGLRSFLDNIGTFTDEQIATVDCAAEAIKSLASAASEIPNSGGWVGAIVGENDLGTFAAQFPKLGEGLAGFVNNIGTFTDEQIATVDCAAKAVATLASVASEIPNSGGWIGAIVGENDLETFAAQFPKLGEGLASFVKNIGTFTEDKIATVNTSVKAIKAIGELSDANLKSLPDFSENLSELGTGIASFCNNMTDEETVKSSVNGLKSILSAVKSISKNDAEAFKSFVDSLKKIGKDAVKKFVEAFTSDATKTDVKDAAKKLGDKAAEGLKDKKKTVKTEGENLAKKAVEGLKTQKDEAETAGKNLGAGYVNGINGKKTAVYNAGVELGKQAAKGINKGQDSHSPSKLAAQSGKWLGEGYIIGIGKMGNLVDKAGNDLGKTATDSLSSSISRISDMVGNDIDTQPTIRPVLDLSDVESGAATLGRMLDMNSSVGVQSNIGAISASMANRQNGADNSEIVAGIKALRKDIANMPRDSVNINGITYSGDSEINNAVQALVRAANIERRA